MQQEMRYAYQVYLDGSFSKAAEHLYITQPALSIAIQRLESALDMPIFDRSVRPPALTPAGEVYIETVRRFSVLEREMKEQMEDIRGLKRGNIRIGGSHYMNAFILPEILSAFSRLYPGIKLSLVEESAAALAELLADRELDLTLNCDAELVERFEHHPAFCDRILLAVPIRDPVNAALSRAALTASDVKKGVHLRGDCPTVDLKRFENTEFLLLTEGNNLRERSERMFERAGISPKIKMELAQLVTAYTLAEHAMGAAFISDRLVRTEKDRLLYYKPDSDLAERQFYILLPERNYTSFAVREFIRFFKRTRK